MEMNLLLLLLVFIQPCVSKFLMQNILKQLPCKTINNELAGYRLEVPEFSKYHVQNIYQCLNLALKMNDIMSVNYNTISMMCSLNREWGTRDFRRNPEFVFVEIPNDCVQRLDHAIESQNNWKQTCKYQECSSQETCLSVDSNKQTVCTNFAVDGVWGSWSAYTNCPVTCGGGQSTRTRVCNDPASAYGGLSCPGIDSESMTCNPQACPVDGGWGTWSSFSACSLQCGGGTRTRTRQCNNPKPVGTGANCPNPTTDNTETSSCITALCPVDGGWGTWSSFSACSVTCGGGTRTRTRQCNNPTPVGTGSNCPNPTTANIETSSCNTALCPVPVNGGWGSWGPYSTCTVTCGGGTQTRTRSCDNPVPAHGGTNCSSTAADFSETTPCSTTVCSVNGGWGAWSYTAAGCSVTCGGGTGTRTRQCNNPTPTGAGDNCPNPTTDNTETSSCNTALCPVNGGWGTWSSFSTCSATCGGGTRTRTRQCNNPTPVGAGANCPNPTTDNTETSSCNTALCPDARCASNNGYIFSTTLNICIKVSTFESDFDGAKTACEDDSGFLFKMDSVEKRNFLKDTIADFGLTSNSYLIGAKDFDNTETFKWLDGTAVNWIGTLPTTANQDCVRYDRVSASMDETHCGGNKLYVCEITVV